MQQIENKNTKVSETEIVISENLVNNLNNIIKYNRL